MFVSGQVISLNPGQFTCLMVNMCAMMTVIYLKGQISDHKVHLVKRIYYWMVQAFSGVHTSHHWNGVPGLVRDGPYNFGQPDFQDRATSDMECMITHFQ